MTLTLCMSSAAQDDQPLGHEPSSEQIQKLEKDGLTPNQTPTPEPTPLPIPTFPPIASTPAATPSPSELSPNVSPMATPRPSPTPTPVPRPPNKVLVAVVDYRTLSEEQLNERLARILKPKALNEPQDDYDTLRRFHEDTILRDWVVENLLAVHAETEGKTTDDAEVEKKIDELSGMTHLGDSKKAEQVLQLRGINPDELRREIRDSIITEKLIQSRIPIYYPEQRLREIYSQAQNAFITPETVHVGHIMKLVAGDETLREKRALRNEMNDLRKRALKGEDWAELAEEGSESLYKEKGGDLGWLDPRNNLPPPLNTEIFEMKIGEVSKIIETQYGLHLVKIFEKKPATGMTFETARDKVEAAVYEGVKNQILTEIQAQHTVLMNASGLPEKSIEKIAVKFPDLQRFIDTAPTPTVP
ncbi:MAG: peptidylprolyl isomerase [bacterium]